MEWMAGQWWDWRRVEKSGVVSEVENYLRCRTWRRSEWRGGECLLRISQSDGESLSLSTIARVAVYNNVRVSKPNVTG
jgi:hypothetical protein